MVLKIFIILIFFLIFLKYTEFNLYLIINKKFDKLFININKSLNGYFNIQKNCSKYG